MRVGRLLVILVIFAVSAFALLVVGAATPGQAAPVRIMPLGDSITGSPGCWRALLWNQLQAAGYTGVDFVGTLPPQGCGQPYDGENEGHGGALATVVANQGQLTGWLAATRPDIVLMHFGTNDVWSAVPTATILAAYSTLVQQMRASNPAMTVLVAQILPMAPSSCPECGSRVQALNAAIPGWAAGLSTAQSPVAVVDQWTGFSTATDTGDGVHPNAAGDAKIAARWFSALTARLGQAPPTTTPAPPTTTPPAPVGGCVGAYTVVGQWPGGSQGDVRVTNAGTAPIPGWTVRFTLPAGQVIAQAWNATVSQSGTAVTATNASWNGSLAAGASAAFGFLISGPGAAPAPPVTCAAR